MKEFTILKMLDRCQGVFTKLDIDYEVMRKILQVKLLMDRRRVPTVIGSMSKKNKDNVLTESNYFTKSLLYYAFFGLLFIPILLIGNHIMLQMSLIFGMMMFFMTTSMISDFSSVLLDVRDKSILSTKAIHPRTISAAKVLHIANYLIMITVALMAPVWMVSIIRYGILFGLIFLVEILLVDIWILVCTALVYYVVLRLFDGEKLKDIINYVQISLSITIAIGYQLVARSFDFVSIDFTWVPSWWNMLLPPIWFAAPLTMLKEASDAYILAMTALALCAPILAAGFYIKLLPKFEQHLLKLSHEGGKGREERRLRTQFLAKLLCPSREERIFFRFVLRMFGSEREFKLKVYPSLGMSFILPFIFLFNTLRDSGLGGLQSSWMYFSIYFCLMVIPTCIQLTKFSGRYKGAWIYQVAPIQDINTIQRAVTKAILLRMFMPVFLLQALIFIMLFGVRIVPDMVIVVLNAIVYTNICYKGMAKSLPFSESFSSAAKDSGLKMIPILLVVIVIAGLHFGISMLPYGQYIYMAVLLILCIWLWTGGRMRRSEVNINA